MTFTKREQEIIYEAVRYYQANHVGPFKEPKYTECDKILQQIEKEIRFNVNS